MTKNTSTQPTSAELAQRITTAHHGISRQKQDRAFQKTMQQARTHMSVGQRAFSRLLHLKAVEKISDTIGGTVARPNTVLYGSLAALILTTVIYVTAKYFGYPLSGSESMTAFIVGWCIGIVIDYTQVLLRGGPVTNKRS